MAEITQLDHAPKEELTFELLQEELKARGITLENSRIPSGLPSKEDFDLAKLKLPKGFKAVIINGLNFLTNYYYISDNFSKDQDGRSNFRDRFIEEMIEKYGSEAEELITKTYRHSKARNNVLYEAVGIFETAIRMMKEYSNVGEEEINKLAAFQERVTGVNNPQNYEGVERIEKIHNLDKVIEEFLITLKKIFDQI